MNQNFSVYKDPGTKGAELFVSKDILSRWVKEYYDQKKVKFFITNLDKNYIITSLESVEKSYDITACYRVKRSGSSNVAQKDRRELEKYLSSYGKTSWDSVKKTLYFHSADVSHGSCKFSINGNNYQLSPKVNKFEVRKLSSTDNANIILTLRIKQGITQCPAEIETFKQSLE